MSTRDQIIQSIMEYAGGTTIPAHVAEGVADRLIEEGHTTTHLRTAPSRLVNIATDLHQELETAIDTGDVFQLKRSLPLAEELVEELDTAEDYEPEPHLLYLDDHEPDVLHAPDGREVTGLRGLGGWFVNVAEGHLSEVTDDTGRPEMDREHQVAMACVAIASQLRLLSLLVREEWLDDDDE